MIGFWGGFVYAPHMHEPVHAEIWVCRESSIMSSILRRLLLPKCPVCGNGNWPVISRESSRRLCVSCNSELEEDTTHRYVAGVVFLLMTFVAPVIAVGYTQSPLVIVTILAIGAYCYLRIRKFVLVGSNHEGRQHP